MTIFSLERVRKKTGGAAVAETIEERLLALVRALLPADAYAMMLAPRYHEYRNGKDRTGPARPVHTLPLWTVRRSNRSTGSTCPALPVAPHFFSNSQNSARLLVRGKSSSGTGVPKKSHSGSQPSFT